MRTGEVSAHSRAWRFERHVVEAWIDHAANRAFSNISSMLDFNRNTHFCPTLLTVLTFFNGAVAASILLLI